MAKQKENLELDARLDGIERAVAHIIDWLPRAEQPKPQPPRKPTRLDALLSWIVLILVVAVIGTVAGVAYVATHQPESAPSAAQQEQPTFAPLPEQPRQPAYNPAPAPAAEQPAASYDQTLPDSAQGAWAPGGNDGLSIGGRKYRTLGDGSLELDDGTTVWLATTQPAPVEQPAAPSVDEAQPTSAPIAAQAAPAQPQPASISELAQDQVERIAIVGSAALDPQHPAEAMQHASDAVTVGKVLVKAFGQVLNIPGALQQESKP